MENNSASPSENCPQFTNPILVVLSGRKVEQKLKLLERFFGSINGYMAAQLYENFAELVEDSNLIPIPVNFEEHGVFFTAMDAAIRKNKVHKYSNNNDLTVCLFVDSASSIPLQDICEQLHKLLNGAYYNRVFFDVYYLLWENFMSDVAGKTRSANAEKQVLSLGTQEWVRYVFLASDVNSKGQLIADEDKLFRMVLTAMFLTNCSIDGRDMTELQDLLMRVTENGKFFTLGQAALYQSAQQIDQVIRTELLEHLSTGTYCDKDLPKQMTCLATLYSDIFDEVWEESCQIEHIGCYTYAIPTDMLTNVDCLDILFHENPALYMKEVKVRCQRRLMERIPQYWQRVKAWLNDLLCQCGASICAPECGTLAAAVADAALDHLQQQFQKEAAGVCKQFLTWKNQMVEKPRRRWWLAQERFAYRLLDQWRRQKVEELVYEFLDEYIYDIRTRVKLWKEEITRTCVLFAELQHDAQREWAALLRDSSPTERLLLKYRKKMLSAYLRRESHCVDACCRQLNALLGRQTETAEMAGVIYRHTEQLRWEGEQSAQSWADPRLPDGTSNPEVEALYNALYSALKVDAPLNTRRHIPNASTYICFFGGTQDRFISYVRQQNEFQYIPHFEDGSIALEVFCFQHLSTGSDFFWKEHMDEGGRGS